MGRVFNAMARVRVWIIWDFCGFSLSSSPRNQHQILKVIKWLLLIARNRFLKVIEQLQHTLIELPGQLRKILLKHSEECLKFKAICEVVPQAYQKVRRHELQITLSLTNLRLNFKKEETSWGWLSFSSVTSKYYCTILGNPNSYVCGV